MTPISLGYVNPSLEFFANGAVRPDPSFLDPDVADEPARQIDMRQMQNGNIRFVVLGIANPDKKLLPGSTGLEYVARIMAGMRDGFDEHSAHCRSALYREDLTPALFRSDTRTAFLLSLSGTPINGSLQNLALFHRLGVRSIHPFSSDPAVGGFSGWGDTKRGLTRFGRDLLREAQQMGMVVDLSHTNDRTFREALRVVEGPIVVSHSNARALRNIDRNCTDAQIRAVADNGGVIGIHFSSSFLSEPTPEARAQRAAAIQRDRKVIERITRRNLSPEKFLHQRYNAHLFDEAAGGLLRREPVIRAPIERLVEHLLHMLEIGGEDHIAIGSDYTNGDNCSGVARAECLPQLLESLAQHGLSKSTIRKLAWENWLRVYRHWLPSRLANSPRARNPVASPALSKS